MDNIDFTRPIERCFLCNSTLAKPLSSQSDYWSYACPACGDVDITREAVHDLPSSQNYLLSGFTRERTELGLPRSVIESDNVAQLLSSLPIPRTFTEKVTKVFEYLERSSRFIGQMVNIFPERDYPISYSPKADELWFILEQMHEKGWIKFSHPHVQLNLDGWNEIKEMKQRRRISNQVFVAMWFSKETDEAYFKGIGRAITECGYSPVRVDRIEHNERIDDRIIAEIRKSAFLVADFTGQRGGVYFETGFAMGLGMPVIWLCRKDQIDDLQFDTRQYYHIVWETPADLYEKLRDRIEATIVK
jgi:predicted RNA-binding Zn-ribbon protein involved in translation (DUF1610 family)/nucleoside 2-deoxyribosyltransferase